MWLRRIIFTSEMDFNLKFKFEYLIIKINYSLNILFNNYFVNIFRHMFTCKHLIKIN